MAHFGRRCAAAAGTCRRRVPSGEASLALWCARVHPGASSFPSPAAQMSPVQMVPDKIALWSKKKPGFERRRCLSDFRWTTEPHPERRPVWRNAARFPRAVSRVARFVPKRNVFWSTRTLPRVRRDLGWHWLVHSRRIAICKYRADSREGGKKKF